jgi:hypothetical protein
MGSTDEAGPWTPGAAPSPRRVFWELTRACDHRCIHCRTRCGETVAYGATGSIGANPYCLRLTRRA